MQYTRAGKKCNIQHIIMCYVGSQSFKYFCFTITLQKYIWSLVAVSNSGNIISIPLFDISSYKKNGY